VLVLPSAAHAIAFTGTGSGATLNPTAVFTIQSNVLTVTLRNAGDSMGTSGQDVPGNQSSGLFFDLPPGITLPPQSGMVGAGGSLVHPGSCRVGPCAANASGGTNLDGPASGAVDGISFAQMAPITGSNTFNPNGLSSVPLIDGAVVFRLAISGGTLLESHFTSVSFQ
jgi:hypothetical protein